MKKIMIIIIALKILIIPEISGQVKEKFKYERSPFSNHQFKAYTVTPIFDQTKMDGIVGLAEIKDQKYINEMFYNIIKKIIPDEKLKKLHYGSYVKMFINSRGEILYCWFLLDSLDINIINEDELYKLYNEFKNFKIDTSKVTVSTGGIPPFEKACDCAIIGGSLVTSEYRNKPK